jgi:hypothetical protein
MELDTEEDFLSCAQREKETLPDFYRRFLHLKAQAPDVLDDQVVKTRHQMPSVKSITGKVLRRDAGWPEFDINHMFLIATKCR